MNTKTGTGVQDDDVTGTFGYFLRMEIKKRGVSPNEFADQLGVTHKTIHKFLNHGIAPTYGTKTPIQVGNPQQSVLKRIAEYTNVSTSTLLALVEAGNVRLGIFPHNGTAKLTSNPKAAMSDAAKRLLAERIVSLNDEDRREIENHICGIWLRRQLDNPTE